MSKVFLHVMIDVRSDKYQEFITYFKKHIEIVNQEQGCEYIEIFKNPDQPNMVHVYETWSDRDSWELHMSNTNSKNWKEFAADLVFGETIVELSKI